MQWTAPYELRKLTVKWDRAVGVTPVQDAGYCTFHFLNLTGGNPDASWITADYTTVEAGFDTLWTTLKPYYHTSTKLTEYSWRADGPAFRPRGSSLSPTLRVTARAVAGTGTGILLPPQCAVSVTEVIPAKYTVEDVEGVGTQTRNRWGRFYLPAPTDDIVAAGRVASGACDVISTGVKTFYNAMVAADLVPVVYSPTVGTSWALTEVHVDDIFDVIRSRRYVTPLSRHVNAINQP